MYSDTVYLTLRYNPVDCIYECTEYINNVICTGSYDDVENFANKKVEDGKKWIDGPVYKIVDKRSIRQDYIPKHPIHPKREKYEKR